MRSLTLVLLFILSISAANSQSETDELTNTLLWEVTHPISKVSSYIFGTIHLIPEDKYNISDSLTHCINRVDEIFFEIDLSGMEDLGNLHTLLSKMIMKNDTLISDLLPEDKSTLLFQKLNERGIPPFIVEKIKPIFISMILESPSLTDNKEGEDALNMKSYEIELNAMAVEMGKEIKGLETIEEREAVGKNKQGQIQIKAYNESGQVTIEIIDDGRGLNSDKIIKKDIEKEVITPDQVDKMSKQQIYGLIFSPGFSKAEKIK